MSSGSAGSSVGFRAVESGATETPVGEAPAPLDWAQKQKTSYCIPIWLRDLQIEASIKRVKGRIKPATETSDEPCAVVCFGPSLNDTWEAIRDFKHIISCSGAHKFLIEHGIIPNIHIEVDPRAHKVELMGPPHKDVKYLIASACHAAVFDHLEGFDVDLWHVFDNQAEAMRTLPRSEWALTGGSSVGLRAMTIARFLGFKNLHIFGMDGSAGKSGSHTTAHPNAPPSFRETVYNGVTYQTTPSMLECARGTTHEMNQMPDVVATFYGDGLVQAMMKDYKRSDAKALMPIGFSKPDLISPEYLELNRRLHRGNVFYGVGG
ncbi:MAG: 6-hydroxymethylpterin diphosphokinase MptE-like, partial [Nitrospirota bacterium]|nr:6-hydroxymethylpterin diphosphokinase MptE-like [Nitrospirota bacterium]